MQCCPGLQVVQADPRADLISTIDIGSWANVHPVGSRVD